MRFGPNSPHSHHPNNRHALDESVHFHSPVRREDETQADYKLRRHNSNIIARFAQAIGLKMIAEKCRRRDQTQYDMMIGKSHIEGKPN